MTSSPSRGQISNNSKKIQKSSFTPSLKNEKDSKGKTYTTFKNDQKELILNDLRKGVSLRLNLDINDEALLTTELLTKIDLIPLNEYNNLLKKVLRTHVENFKDETKVLTQWRKKVKSWVVNTGKPETRGGLVVAVDRQEEFRQRVIQILNELPFRCFKTLKNKLLEVLEEFHNASQDPKPFNTKTCSKHWWFNFIGRNEDIKEQWENILLERSVNKLNGKKNNSIFSSPSREDTASSPAEEQVVSESTAMGSQESSPVRENYQNNFDGLHCGMEEEELPNVQLTKFDSYAINEMNLLNFDFAIDEIGNIDQYLNFTEASSAEETNGGSDMTLYSF